MAKKSSGRGAGTPATTALDRAGVAYALLPYDHDPDNRHFGEEASAALGIDPERMFKTLLVDCSGEVVVAVVPVAGMLDTKALAEAVGAKKAVLVEPADAERITGMVVGGISPLGQKRALRTVVDAGAQAFDTICVSAGRRGLQLELAPADLVALTRATLAAIARG
ncbi:Cys-tRNA(Pro) deacylase [Ammonicoccus fulvus]|uniref:Cys-tRNA(Pro)/Cys-tRNA(Cys) deacylase n=1 Tax=Ammonicoccus fulvus TaxID=3138240 RepID=A0ABZ3FS58_9ACTN